MFNSFFYNSESGKWTKPFPVHDLGGYPIVNGVTYGYDMPVEEAGNALIMTAAIAVKENDPSYAKEHWEVLSTWAEYLSDNGLDSGEQFFSDNFAGDCPHNANLLAKAILGLASYARLAEMLNNKDEADKYMKIAKEMAKEWEEAAYDGDHYRLAFDQSDTWSQKYNLVWDRLMCLNVFLDRTIAKETAFYENKMNAYGCPFDNRHDYTKADWTVWTASMFTDRGRFRNFILPLYRFMHETRDRTLMADLINTDRAEIAGFTGRPVVGGYYIRLLQKKLSEER